jgi:hypothetical protein
MFRIDFRGGARLLPIAILAADSVLPNRGVVDGFARSGVDPLGSNLSG